MRDGRRAWVAGGLEVVSNGQRRHVAVVCAAESRGAAAQIALDVNEKERHVYKSIFRIADLQIIPPMASRSRYAARGMTEVVDFLGLPAPIVQAGMGAVARHELAAAVSETVRGV